jgi:hypothetical protein
MFSTVLAETNCHGLLARVASLAALLATAACCVAAASEKPLTYVDILHQLTDLDRLTHLQAGCKGGLFSSWDRNSRTHWGANGDAGQYLRVEPNGEAVMMDIDGPGVVYRIWSANPIGKVDLAAGRHVLRFQAVGHHPESKGYLMGIDHVIIK